MPAHALVLVVEDEPAIAETLTYCLATEGFRVIHAPTLGQARTLLADQPQCIVLDVGLPDGSGFDFCRELRRTSEVPVLFLTARSHEIDRIVGLELGADDYVAKPFSPREVAARVKAILRRGRPAATAATTARGALVIDAEQLKATWRDTALALTRAEFRVLHVLAGRPGRVFSRSDLLDAAWDDPGEPSDRAVDTVIKRLRAVLKAVAPGSDPIRTVRGEGYAWDEPG